MAAIIRSATIKSKIIKFLTFRPNNISWVATMGKEGPRIGLTSKLFLAFLLTSVAVVALLVLLMQWSFDRGLLNYVNQMEIERLDYLTEALETAYATHGNWLFLRRNHRRWHQLLKGVNTWEPAEHSPQTSSLAQRRRLTTEPALSSNDMLTPRLSDTGRRGPVQQPVPPSNDPLRIAPRISMLDAAKRVVIGDPNIPPGSTLRPIRYGNKTVGWLSIAPLQTLTAELDLRFQEQQSRAFYLIAAVVIAIAALVSILLARHLLTPVRALATGTRALTAGKFDARIRVTATDELGQLATDFNILANTLEKNEQARRQWVADISHELRTPLAILRGEIEAMEDGIRELSATALQSLHAEVLRLNKLVEDLYELSLSDIGALNYRKTSIDLVQILDDALKSFGERFARHQIAIEATLNRDKPVRVFADAARLFQLFANLLENSLRYTDPGGQLKVNCINTGKTAAIHLQDSAPGVPAKALSRLFDRLYRVDASRSRAEGGAGLGLAICKNIVDAHGGEIVAKPSPLGGLWVEITLPLKL